MNTISLLLIATFATSRLAAENEYFPANSISRAELFSATLSAMAEPVLSPVGKPKTYFALRILYLHGWVSQSVAVRYEGEDGEFVRRSVSLTGKSKSDPGKIVAREARITKEAVADVFSVLDKAQFWNLATEDGAGGFDGSNLLIEVIKDGKHRVFVRWAPESNTANRRLSDIVAFYRAQFHGAGFWPVQPPQAEQPGAGQPATKPADKAPAKDQPSTPTSESVPR